MTTSKLKKSYLKIIAIIVSVSIIASFFVMLAAQDFVVFLVVLSFLLIALPFSRTRY